MIHLKTTCDKSREKVDGTHPIVFRITVKSNMRTISSGLSCLPNDWDFKKNVLKDKTQELLQLGKRLKDMELRLLNKIREYEQEYPTSSDIKAVCNYLSNKKERDLSVKEFWLEEVKRLRRSNKFSNAMHYENRHW